MRLLLHQKKFNKSAKAERNVSHCSSFIYLAAVVFQLESITSLQLVLFMGFSSQLLI